MVGMPAVGQFIEAMIFDSPPLMAECHDLGGAGLCHR
jgi:hypothetical protein